MPVTAGLGLEGLKTVGGIVQSIFGAGRARKAQKGLENLKTPTYTPNKAISDYYQTALSKATTNPYQSAGYINDKNNAAGSEAAGLNTLGNLGRGAAVAGVGRLTALNNKANLQAGAKAEQGQRQDIAQLGAATNLQNKDYQTAFQVNKLMPYQKQFGILASQAQGGNQMLNAGITNAFGGLSGASDLLASKYYTDSISGKKK